MFGETCAVCNINYMFYSHSGTTASDVNQSKIVICTCSSLAKQRAGIMLGERGSTLQGPRCRLLPWQCGRPEMLQTYDDAWGHIAVAEIAACNHAVATKASVFKLPCCQWIVDCCGKPLLHQREKVADAISALRLGSSKIAEEREGCP